MATIIDALLVTLGLDDAEFQKRRGGVDEGLKKTREAGAQTAGDLHDFTKKAGVGFSKLRGEVVGLFLAFAGAKTVSSFLTDVIKTTAEVGRASSVMGVNINTLNAWGDAAKAAGGDAKDAQGAFGVVNDYFADFTRNPGNIGAHAMLFRQLGLSGKQGDFADPEKLILGLADQYQKEKSQAEKSGDPNALHRVNATFAQRLREFGITSDAMIGFIEKGRPAMERQIDLYKKQDKVTQADADAAQQFNTELTNLEKTLVGLARGPMTTFLHALNVMLDDLTTHGFGFITKVHSDDPGYGKGHKGGFSLSDIWDMFTVHGPDKASTPSPVDPMLFQRGGGGGGGRGLNGDIVAYAQSKGLSPAQARALAAVNAGEGGGLHQTNHAGGGHGAFGLFQIRDSGGLQKMLRQYGPAPTLKNQVDFYLANNAKGASFWHHGNDEGAALRSLIVEAQRAGGDTRALWGRAQRALGGGGLAHAAHRLPVPVRGGPHKTTVNVTVHANGHSDPHAIAKQAGHAVKRALQGANKVANANSGVS